jgi:hypothetical protein
MFVCLLNMQGFFFTIGQPQGSPFVTTEGQTENLWVRNAGLHRLRRPLRKLLSTSTGHEGGGFVLLQAFEMQLKTGDAEKEEKRWLADT